MLMMMMIMMMMTIPRKSGRSFTVAGPRLWNNLPLHLLDSEHTFLEFRRLLKTHLFCWEQRRLVTVAFWAPYKFAFTLQLHLWQRKTQTTSLSTTLIFTTTKLH